MRNYTQKRPALLWPSESLICLIKPVRTLTPCIPHYFPKEDHDFHYSFISLAPYHDVISLPYFPWPCKNMYPFKHFSIKSINLKHIFCCLFLSKEVFHRVFITSVIFIFKAEVKITHAENEKPRKEQTRIRDEQPSFSLPYPHLLTILSGQCQGRGGGDTPPPPDLNFSPKFLHTPVCWEFNFIHEWIGVRNEQAEMINLT